MADLAGQVVVVTGAAGNLGGAVARSFLSAGARLVLVDHAPDRLQALFPDLVNSPDHKLATSIDLTNAAAVSLMAEQAVKRFGRLDVLVNTVGGFDAGTPVHETTADAWAHMFTLNLRTMLVASRAVVPYMLLQESGKIVNVAARAALHGSSTMAPYSASKSAVMRATESMAAELKNRGINVNCVMPSIIDTDQNRAAMPKANHDRWVRPEAIADVILFLASSAARAINGAAIPVYGGG